MKSLRSCAIFGLVASSAAALASAPTFSRTGSVSLESLISKQADCQKHGLDVPPPLSAIQLLKLRYQTLDTHGKPTFVSGLLILPKAAPMGIVLYYHGTILRRELAPSRYTGASDLSESEYVMMAFASGGYAVFMPDTLGLGDSRSVHPYPFGESNYRSGIDMVGPGRAIAKSLGVSVGRDLFVTGYSEGGAVAMCAVRQLEKDHTLTPKMAAPMCGPYDLTGATTISLLKGKQSLEGFGTKLFLLSYAAYSASSDFESMDLKSFFAPSFASYVPYVFGLKLDELGMAKRFINKAVQLGDVDSIDRILTKRFRDSLTSSDMTNPIIALMAKSNCFDWSPHTKMLLVYLKGDTVVVDANSTEALAAMRAKGVGSNVVQPFEISERKLNHYTVPPAAYSAVRRFFDGGFSGVWPSGVPSAPMSSGG